MSIKIHHGPPGSYKTSGAIADDFKAAVLAGRHIITNVRGLSDRDQVIEVIKKQAASGIGFLKPKKVEIPDTFQLTYIKTDPTDTDFPEVSCSDNMEMLRRFWHWAPAGVFFIIDEVQEVWPKSYRDTHLKKLEYPGGIESANRDSRFLDIALAFEKHRHKNWDFIVTTPNINKVHPVVRGASEAAYKHKNLAMLGELFKGRYIEGFHAADTNGKPSDFYSVTRKKVPSYVFKLYKSTATGIVRDTTAGQSIFRNPKILGLGLLVLGLAAYLFSAGTPRMFSQPAQQVSTGSAVSSAPSAAGNAPVSAAASGAVRPDSVSRPAGIQPPPRLAFLSDQAKVTIMASYEVLTSAGRNVWRFVIRFELPNGGYVDVTEKNFPKLGLSVSRLDACLIEFKAGDYSRLVYCSPPDDLPDMTQTDVASSDTVPLLPPSPTAKAQN